MLINTQNRKRAVAADMEVFEEFLLKAMQSSGLNVVDHALVVYARDEGDFVVSFRFVVGGER